MDGFTGYNPVLAIYQIRNISNYGERISTEGKSMLKTFFDEIHLAWCSPKAVEFKEKLYQLEADIFFVEYVYKNIAFDVQEACNKHALVNGMNLINEIEEKLPIPDSGVYVSANFEEMYSAHPQTGAVGMNKRVIDQAASKFYSSILQLIDMINATPCEVALYDENGTQMEDFSYLVKKQKSRIVTSLKAFSEEIVKALYDEIDVIISAKDQATTTLNS